MKAGCDVASHQGTVDYDRLAAALPGGFVLAKATEGVGFRDPLFSRNWSEPKRVGLARGAYHFARPSLGNAAQDEARWFLSQLGPLDAGDMLALDYEDDFAGDVVAWCKTWLDLVRAATGLTPYVYLNRSHMTLDWSAVIAAGYPLWLAAYDGDPDAVIATPWPRVAIKQWTSTGRVDGIAGNVDLDVMAEDEMDKDTFDKMASVWWRDVAQGPATLDAMKTAYDPVVRFARDNGALDAAEEQRLADLETRLAKLRQI